MIGIDVGSDMLNKQTCCYVRIPFTVDASEIDTYNSLTLKIYYDDGFVAYLNGVKVAEWNSTATDNHEAENWETFDISVALNRLSSGENILSLQALNVTSNSSDFIIGAELFARTDNNNSGKLSENAIEYTTPLTINKTTQGSGF